MPKTKLHNNIQSFLKLSNVITVGETIGCCAEFFGEMLTEKFVQIANRSVKDLLLCGVRGTGTLPHSRTVVVGVALPQSKLAN